MSYRVLELRDGAVVETHKGPNRDVAQKAFKAATAPAALVEGAVVLSQNDRGRKSREAFVAFAASTTPGTSKGLPRQVATEPMPEKTAPLARFEPASPIVMRPAPVEEREAEVTHAIHPATGEVVTGDDVERRCDPLDLGSVEVSAEEVRPIVGGKIERATMVAVAPSKSSAPAHPTVARCAAKGCNLEVRVRVDTPETLRCLCGACRVLARKYVEGGRSMSAAVALVLTGTTPTTSRPVMHRDAKPEKVTDAPRSLDAGLALVAAHAGVIGRLGGLDAATQAATVLEQLGGVEAARELAALVERVGGVDRLTAAVNAVSDLARVS